jgi:hypothetical protein
MVFELIYTSAPKTLDGAGYGVVAKSEGLPGSLERFLKHFNRYDFDLSPEDGKRSTCPDVFSHATFRDSAQLWHVMSRVGIGGIDYTNRWVFLAHHVVISSDELNGATIGGLMRNPSMFQSKWNGRLGVIPPRSLPASIAGTPNGGVWDILAGHRDWARVWVERYSREKTANPSFVVVPGEADVLGLFTEAMALMPPNEGRQVSFITQMIADRDGVDFDWIGLIAGSKLARDAAKRFPDRTFDLTSPMRTPPTSVPQHSQTSKANSKSATAASVGRPAAPIHDDEGFDEYYIAETPQVNPRRSKRRDRDSGAPPPPPPPARLFDNWYVAPLLFMAGVAVTTAVGAAAWRYAALGPAQQKADEPPEVVRVPQEGFPVRDQLPEPAPAVAAKKNQTADPNKTAISSPSTTTIAAHRSPVFRLKRWLLDTLTKADNGTWVTVLEIEDKYLVPPSPCLNLLTSKGSGLESRTLPSDQGEGAIEVVSRERQTGSVKMRLRDGHVLEVLRAEKLDDDLLSRMAYCVLEIRSSLEALKTSGVEMRTARVSFTPELPGAPFFKTPWAIDEALSSGAKAFFKMTHKLQKKDLQARIRVHCMTLSFLPEDETGWKIDHKEKRAESQFDKKFSKTLELALSDGRWPVELSVATRFDGGEQSSSVIDIELIGPHSSGEQKAAEKPDENDDVLEPGSILGGGAVKKGKGRTLTDRQNRARTARDSKPPDQGPVEAKDANSPDRRLGELAKVDPHVFILELFRRYGRLHGSIVVRVQNGSSEEDVEILEFGKARIVTNQ